MRLGICGVVFSGIMGATLALAQQPVSAQNPCAANVSKAGSPATLFKNLRLGVSDFKYQDRDHGGISFSAKAFLAGRTDLAPVRWQVLRLVVHQIWIDHLRRHNWWSDGLHKPQVSYGGLSLYWMRIVETGVETIINQTFNGLADFGLKAAALPLDKDLLRRQLTNQTRFLERQVGAKEQGLQAEFLIPQTVGGKLFIDGEFWPKISKRPELYQNFVQQLSTVWRDELKTGWVQKTLKEIFPYQPDQTYKGLADARFQETTSLLAMVQVLGSTNIHEMTAADALAKYQAIKAELQSRSEIMILALIDRATTSRPWAYQLAMMQITNPRGLDLPEIPIPELKKSLKERGEDWADIAWPLQQFAIDLSPEEWQAWQTKMAHTTQVGPGREKEIDLDMENQAVVNGIRNHFARAKQRRWDHRADHNKDEILQDIGLVEKAVQIMQAHQQVSGTNRQMPLKIISYQMSDILLASKGNACTFYYFNFSSLLFYNRLRIKVE